MMDFNAANSVSALRRMFGTDDQQEALTAATYVRPADLPIGQKLALLTMRRGELAEEVLAACKECLIHPPRLHHFRALVEGGYAIRPGQYHRLTPMGSSAANDVARAMARQLGIHRFTTGGGRFYHTLYCTCGYSGSHSRNEGHWESAQMRMMSRHLAEVEQAKARGEAYVAPGLRALKMIEAAFAPPTQPEG